MSQLILVRHGLITALSLDAPDGSALKLSWRVKNGSLPRFTFGSGRLTLDSFNKHSWR